jgi:oxygen-independent coproporphyrinogen-3 oxidase
MAKETSIGDLSSQPGRGAQTLCDSQLTFVSIDQQRISRQTPQLHPLAETPPADSPDQAASLYLHIPFCFHKCHYCDFYSLVDRRGRQDRFTSRLLDELQALAPFAAPLRTIFVGGGTPTLLRTDLWRALLDGLRHAFDLSRLEEFTVECNPETASDELFETLRRGGVNRLSIGAQSFNTTHLETLERWHEPASVRRSVKLARRHGLDNLSLDLIFAIPGQTLADWRDDLQQALNLGVEHLSCYNLTYEPGTAMFERLRREEFEPVDNDTEAAMYERTLDMLATAGLARYEISNFAKPGRQCRHNLVYWRCQPYLAAGPSASAYLGGWRWKNAADLSAYLGSAGLAPVVDVEPPDQKRELAERLMMGLRTVEGVEVELPEAAQRRAETLELAGYMLHDGACWRLTSTGMLQADTIIADLMALI